MDELNQDDFFAEIVEKPVEVAEQEPTEEELLQEKLEEEL